MTFQRVPNWWGDGKRYFQGMYNFDRIHLRVIPPERNLDYLRRGELDLIQETVPLLAGINRLQLREFMLESDLLSPAGGDVVFERGLAWLLDGLVSDTAPRPAR